MTTDAEVHDIHKAFVPLDGSPRPVCGGSGRSVARAEDVTCPDCLRVAAERLARTAEPDEFAAADEADAIEASHAEENRADVVAQAEAGLHDAHAIPAGDEPASVLGFAINRSVADYRILLGAIVDALDLIPLVDADTITAIIASPVAEAMLVTADVQACTRAITDGLGSLIVATI